MCKDGTRKVVQINSNVYWHNGEFVHTRCFSRDITDLKRAQLRLLEEQRLRLAEAEEYKRKQNDFIDMLCHEVQPRLRQRFPLAHDSPVSVFVVSCCVCRA